MTLTNGYYFTKRMQNYPNEGESILHIGINIALLVTLLSGSAVSAETVRCVANLNGTQTFLTFDPETVKYRSLREQWSPFAPYCPSEAIIAALMPKVPIKYRGGYCLLTDDQSGAYVGAITGVGDRFGRCPKEGAACKVVNNAKDYALAVAGGFAGTIFGSSTALSAAGVTAVEHSSGAYILTGTSGYIGGTLAAKGTTLVAIATAPETLLGAAAGAVMLGGAVLICGE